MGAILQYGLSVALVGISTVFVGLIILIGLIKLMEMIMTGGKGKKKAEAPAPVAAPAPAGEENTTGFVVRSIRRINNAPAWNRAGREEQVYSRM